MMQCQQKQVCPRRVWWGHLQLVVLRAFLGGGVSARTLHASPAHLYPLWCLRASEQLGPVRERVARVTSRRALRCPPRRMSKVAVRAKFEWELGLDFVSFSILVTIFLIAWQRFSWMCNLNNPNLQNMEKLCRNLQQATLKLFVLDWFRCACQKF